MVVVRKLGREILASSRLLTLDWVIGAEVDFRSMARHTSSYETNAKMDGKYLEHVT